MKNLLSKLLEKRGIRSEKELTIEEKKDFDKYKITLSKEVTVDNIKEFCKSQIKTIEGKCDGVTPITNLQQASLHVYFNILKVIEAPEAERESLERHLLQIIES